MAQLLALTRVSLAFGDRVLFTDLTLTISENERVGLIGANGIGKSSLIKLMAGLERPDSGAVARQKGLRTGYVPQVPRFDPEATIEQIIQDAKMSAVGVPDLAPDEHAILNALAFPDLTKRAGELSGGWLKRLALVAGIVARPDLLLLDEPTNHLDAEGIAWLEDYLRQAKFSVVVISHDRAFLEAVGTRIIELGRAYPDGFLASEGGYSRFLLRRLEFLATQEKQVESLENKVRNEVEWLRRGPKARTGKDKTRSDQAHLMIDELADLKERRHQNQSRIDFIASGRKTKRLLVAEGLAMARGGRPLFRDLDLVLVPGMRLGLVGANGSGKSTLLKILSGELVPDAGEQQGAPALKLISFDQHRATLDGSVSLAKSLSPDSDTVRYMGQEVHVAGYARRFGFDSRQLDTPVGRLSGGEQAKLQIARLMLHPADVLLLDEPTNDLDLPTLEILEQNLSEYPGALVLVTHDRFLLDRVATLLLGLDGQGGHAFVADREQWREEMARRLKPAAASAAPKVVKERERQPAKKLSYLEQREYDGLEARIADAEAEVARLKAGMEDPKIACDGIKSAATYEAFLAAEASLDALYARWEELESKVVACGT